MRRSYGLRPQYVLAERSGVIVGVLPAVLLPGWMWRPRLVSLPFLNHAGVLGDSEEVERALLDDALDRGRGARAAAVEVRQSHAPAWMTPEAPWRDRTRKVRMVLSLEGGSDELLRSFPSKLRSQIRRPLKEGMRAEISGQDLLDDFYDVFSRNMRDLGSPVHSKTFFRCVLENLGTLARVAVVRQGSAACAAALAIGFRDTLEILWGSSLRRLNHLAPNMLLYWCLLDLACKEGYRLFDFGRCTPGEGSWRFKLQWGSEPRSLHWYVVRYGREGRPVLENGSSRLRWAAARLWSTLPVSVANRIGPMVRRRISL